MRKRILFILGKHPKIYNLAENFYNILQRIAYKLKGTTSEERYWAERHLQKGDRTKDDWAKGDNDWIASYWNSMDHPHRKLLIDTISNYNPTSVLEIGCNCGPNLFLLAKKFPHATIIGIDINPQAIQKGNELFSQAAVLNVNLALGKADNLEQFQNKSFDIVFSDAVLIYSGPDKIKKVIDEMLRVSRKAIILLEWHDFNSKHNPLGKYKRHWVRDYRKLLKEYVSEDLIKINKLPNNLWPDKNWQKYGALVEIILKA